MGDPGKAIARAAAGRCTALLAAALLTAGSGDARGAGAVFVASVGSDTRNGRTPDAPMRTVSTALRRAGRGATVYLRRGDRFHEAVKVSGVKVGKVKSPDVTDDKKAAVVLDIVNAGFTPFHQDSHCSIRPQSLIGERYVECTSGSDKVGEVAQIPDGQDGAGQHLRLDIPAEGHQVLRRHGVVDPRHVLLDDRAVVELGRHVMGRRADDLHPALEGLVVGARALEARQEGMVDVDGAAFQRCA